MPASMIAGGESKSGSPIPNEITSFIVDAISKNFRIPEGFKDATRSDRYDLAMVSPLLINLNYPV